ncbi:MAG: hypothetical protein CSA39_03560 [Flavobacteriales bacterium]|nr:MAG: hypothetical protein CSA39_03560 [Flavobacteriales bacterium]
MASDQIINRVANSKLITIDLEEFYPKGKRVLLDISKWLYKGLVLREKDFRQQLKLHNWQQYSGQYIALTCSTGAIVPSWAYMLVTTHLASYAKKIVAGDLALLEFIIYSDIIDKIEVEDYKNKPVIIKGCDRLFIPETAKIQLLQRLMPIAKSIMFGEACSTVPLYKKKN